MKSAHIAVLVVRLFALYLALSVVLGAANLTYFFLISTQSGDVARSWAVGSVITLALQCGLAGLVYALAPLIAGRIAGEPAVGPVEDRLDLGRLALRIAGILIIDGAFTYVPELVDAQWGGGAPVVGSTMTYLLVLFITCAGLGVLLYWKAAPLARRLFATTVERDVARSALAQAIGFSLLGAWVVVGVFPDLLERLVAQMQFTGGTDGFFGLTPPRGTAHLATELLRLTVGLVLFFSAGVIARGWHKLRTAGLPRTDGPVRAGAVESKP